MSELVYPLTPAPMAAGVLSSDPREELLPIVQESGLVVAQAPRSFVHGGSFLLHPVVHLHVLDREGRIYLQKRAMSKKLLPGRWDTAVGGHVSYGESIREALCRESSEELGLYDFNPVYLGNYVFESKVEHELVFIFAVVGAFEPKPNPEEVEAGRFWTPAEIAAKTGRSILTPNFEGEYKRISDALQALL